MHEASAPHLAPVFAAPEHAHQLPPPRKPRLAFQHLPEHDPVAPEQRVDDPVERRAGDGVVGRKPRVDQAPSSGVAEGVHPAAGTGAPAPPHEGAEPRVAVGGHVAPRHQLRETVLDLGGEEPRLRLEVVEELRAARSQELPDPPRPRRRRAARFRIPVRFRRSPGGEMAAVDERDPGRVRGPRARGGRRPGAPEPHHPAGEAQGIEPPRVIGAKAGREDGVLPHGGRGLEAFELFDDREQAGRAFPPVVETVPGEVNRM